MPNWTEIRKFVLKRDKHTCVKCEETHPTSDLHIHHLIPRSAGGGDELSNLVTLCRGCHGAKHPFYQVGLARKFIERWSIKIAKWIDSNDEILNTPEGLGLALRLFGHDRFRDGQLDVILPAFAGESVLYVSPTGSGKTLCFQLPALLKQSHSYVVTPLKALMFDQVSSLMTKKIPASYINEDVRSEKAERYEMLGKGLWKFFYLTPERLDKERVSGKEVEFLANNKPDYFIVDEAHCIDKWGQDFRPSYSKLNKARKALGTPPLLAFTATAGMETQDRIIELFGVSDAVRVVRDVDRPNIALFRKEVPNEQARNEIIGNLLTYIDHGRAMIFVPTIKTGAKVSKYLTANGHDAPFYHGQLDKVSRHSLQNRFSGKENPELRFIVATNAFGMGIDIPDIRLVVHWQPPSSIEDYVQEFGRAGRDGKPSLAVVFYGRDYDEEQLERLAKYSIEESSLSHEDKIILQIKREKERNELFSLLKNREVCFRYKITEYFGHEKRKDTIGKKLIRLIFEKRTKTVSNTLCCDSCSTISTNKKTTLIKASIGCRDPKSPSNLLLLEDHALSYVLTFGKYRGKTITECPKDYLEWLANGGRTRGGFQAKPDAIKAAHKVLHSHPTYKKRQVSDGLLIPLWVWISYFFIVMFVGIYFEAETGSSINFQSAWFLAFKLWIISWAIFHKTKDRKRVPFFKRIGIGSGLFVILSVASFLVIQVLVNIVVWGLP